MIEWLDRYRESHPMRPTRSQVIRLLLQREIGHADFPHTEGQHDEIVKFGDAQ
jgi:hypothetical protein